METTQDPLTIETAFKWGPPEEIDTKLGKRIRRKAPKTPEADAWFERNRRECAVAGIVYGEWPPNSNKWAYTWWKQIPKDITGEREKNAELSRATHSDHEIPHPKGMDYFGYQKAGIVFMRGKMGVLLADDLGLGKTCQIIGRINDEPKICKVLIAVPAYLTINWEREIRRWLVRDLSVGVADGKCLPTSDIVIISHGMLVKWEEQLCSRHWDLFAVDEAHAFKNPKAQRSRVVLGYKPKRDEPVSMARAPLPARQRVFATGTPLCNKPEDLWPLVSLLCPMVFNNWYRFHTRYCGLRQGDFGMVREKDGMHLSELQETLRANVMIRRLKREVLKDLPPLRRTIVTFEAPPGVIAAERSACHGTAADDLQEAIERAMKDATTDEARYIAAAAALKTVGIDFDQMSIVRHQTALAKVPLCIEHITNLLEETDEKIIVWAHHKDVMEKMAEGLSKYGVLVSHGGHSVAVRQGNVDRFQSDPDIRVHVCSITGMGTGNTQTAATTAVFVELDWMPSNNTQAESRLHRIGQREAVLVQHLVCSGTIDARLVEVTIAKQEMADQALNIAPSDPPPVAPNPAAVAPSQASDHERLSAKMNIAAADAILAKTWALAVRCRPKNLSTSGIDRADAAVITRLSESPMLAPRDAATALLLLTKYQKLVGITELRALYAKLS